MFKRIWVYLLLLATLAFEVAWLEYQRIDQMAEAFVVTKEIKVNYQHNVGYISGGSKE